MNANQLKSKIREVKDFPTPGVSFKDIAPLFEDRVAFRAAIDGLAGFFKDKKIDKVVGIDARGFLLSSAVAYLLGAGHVMARKKGKLPHHTINCRHSLEYGHGLLEMHIDSIAPGEKVLIIDDVLATGGTAGAAAQLVRELKGDIVGFGFLLELASFKGREKFSGHEVQSLLIYES